MKRIILASLSLETTAFHSNYVNFSDFYFDNYSSKTSFLRQLSNTTTTTTETSKRDTNNSADSGPYISKNDQGLVKSLRFIADDGANECFDFLYGPYHRAFTGGRATKEAFRCILKEVEQFFGDLSKNDLLHTVHGVYLDLHGALGVVDVEDAQAVYVETIRNFVGYESVLISASFDLHGNISKRLCNALNMMTAYRTAPHIDIEETKIKAMTMLLNALVQSESNHTNIPLIYHIPVPILVSGEKSCTTVEPAKSLYERLDIASIESILGILDASLFMGCPWTDEPHVCTSITITCLPASLPSASTAARHLATELWNYRHQFTYPPNVTSGSFTTCLQLCRQQPRDGITFICDLGDSPCAGGTGDVPYCLAVLFEQGYGEVREDRHTNVLLSAVWDEAFVKRCIDVGVGGWLCGVCLGGNKDVAGGKGAKINRGEVVKIVGEQEGVGGVHVLVRCGECVDVIVTQKRKAFLWLDDFSLLGLHLKDYNIVVIKSGYLSPSMCDLASRILFAETPGSTNPILQQLKFQKIRTPIFPFHDLDFLSELSKL